MRILRRVHTTFHYLLSIPLIVFFSFATLLMLLQIEKEEKKRVNLITDRDYGEDVSGKNFLLMWVMVALIALIIIALILKGKGI